MSTSASQSSAQSAPATASRLATQAGHFPLFAVLVLAFLGFLSLTTELLPAGLLTDIAPDLGSSVGVTGSVISAYALGNVITVLPLTHLALRLTRRTALLLAAMLLVISNGIVVSAPNLAVAVVGRFVGGAAHGLIWAILPAVVVRLGGARYAGRAMTIVFTANSLGLALGAPLSALLGNSLGWRMAFVVAGLAALLVGALLFAVVPHMRTEQHEHVRLHQAVMLPGALRVCLGWALVMLGHFGVISYIAPYLERLGVGAGVIAWSLFILGTAGILGVILAGRLARRSLMAGLIAAPVLIAVAMLVLLLAPGSLPLVLAILIVWGMGFSGTVLLYQQAVLVTGQRAPETVTSISVVLSQLGIALGATLGGIVVDNFGVNTLPLVGVVFAAIASLMLPGVGKILRINTQRAK